jgi:hypothetical protein
MMATILPLLSSLFFSLRERCDDRPRRFGARGPNPAAHDAKRVRLARPAAGFPLYASLGFVTLAEDAAWVKGHSTQTRA